jgi:putative transposase
MVCRYVERREEKGSGIFFWFLIEVYAAYFIIIHMARPPRASSGGTVYHVLNRANARMRIFARDSDYHAFENVLAQAHTHVPMRLLSYCLMPNHWHMVLWPYEDGDLSQFMRWVSVTHTQRWHAAHGTSGCGHVYQGRFKSFPTQSDGHLLMVCRYVERNALRAGLVRHAQDWRWSSLWRRLGGNDTDGKSVILPLSNGPTHWPDNWCSLVNTPQTQKEEDALRTCIARGRPFGTDRWVQTTVKTLALHATIRPRGRPRKEICKEKDS